MPKSINSPDKISNQEILTKAIEKAIVGGWVPFDNNYRQKQSPERILDWIYNGGFTDNGLDYLIFIFSHDFAKALWGDEGTWITRHYTPTGLQLSGQEVPYWKVHLQQMVIADDPIAYLGDNI